MRDYLQAETQLPGLTKKKFGNDFFWGVSSSAVQTEGAWNLHGKGLSIWDVFSEKKKKILSAHHPKVASDFYARYAEDIAIIQSLNIPNFRFSLSWPRILPNGTG